MSTRQATAQTTKQMLQQRGAEATRDLRAALQLPSGLNDTAILGTALAEAAVREIRRNPQFASDVRRSYEELVQAGGGRASRSRAGGQSKEQDLPPLVPIRTGEAFRPPDPFAPPDPAFLIYVYGKAQLGRALHEYTVDMLKLTAAKIEREHPGTKPTNRGQRAALIDYIVRYS